MKSKRNHMQIDHYDPILNGGTNDVSNLVLTCASCNLKKGTFDGDRFERIAKKMRPPEVGRRLGKMRRKLGIFRSRRSSSC